MQAIQNITCQCAIFCQNPAQVHRFGCIQTILQRLAGLWAPSGVLKTDSLRLCEPSVLLESMIFLSTQKFYDNLRFKSSQ